MEESVDLILISTLWNTLPLEVHVVTTLLQSKEINFNVLLDPADGRGCLSGFIWDLFFVILFGDLHCFD